MKYSLKSLAAAGLFALAASATALPTLAADYVIDSQGAHASINFQVSHLGYSFVVGRFDTFTGSFSFDEKSPPAGLRFRLRLIPPASIPIMLNAISTFAALISCPLTNFQKPISKALQLR